MCVCVGQGLRYCTPRRINLSYSSYSDGGRKGWSNGCTSDLHFERNLNNKNRTNMSPLGLHPNCRLVSVTINWGGFGWRLGGWADLLVTLLTPRNALEVSTSIYRPISV